MSAKPIARLCDCKGTTFFSFLQVHTQKKSPFMSENINGNLNKTHFLFLVLLWFILRSSLVHLWLKVGKKQEREKRTVS